MLRLVYYAWRNCIMKNENSGAGEKSRFSPVTIIILIICIAVFLVSAFKIFSYVQERKAASDAYSDLKQVVQVEDSRKSNTEEDKNIDNGDSFSVDFDALSAINDDITGWIRCEGTKIDYPVMHTDNNDYYLSHLYDGKVNSSGAIFMDSRNEDINSDKNVVIYGHSMKNGTMFNSLKKYKDQKYYENYPEIMLYTPDGNYVMELVSGTIEDGYEDFLRFDFEDEDDYINYVQSFIDRSSFVSDVTVSSDDRIATLCTCSYEKENARYVVIGKLTPVKD